MRHSKIIAAIVAACLLCGCQRATTRTLFDGEDLRVEQRGREMTIYDLTTGKSYVLIRHRVKKSAQQPGPRTLVRTDSIEITCEGATTTIRTATGVFLTIVKGKIQH